jgi:hypothetical protein
MKRSTGFLGFERAETIKSSVKNTTLRGSVSLEWILRGARRTLQ